MRQTERVTDLMDVRLEPVEPIPDSIVSDVLVYLGIRPGQRALIRVEIGLAGEFAWNWSIVESNVDPQRQLGEIDRDQIVPQRERFAGETDLIIVHRLGHKTVSDLRAAPAVRVALVVAPP